MELSEIQTTVASEEAVVAAQRYLAPIKLFARNFSPANAVPYSGVAVPVFDLSAAQAFDEEENNWCNAETIKGEVVQLSAHLKQSVALPDVVAGAVGDRFFLRDGARALGRSIGAGVEKIVMDAIIAGASAPEAATIDITSSETVRQSLAMTFGTCALNGVDPYDSVLVLSPALYGAVIASQPYNVIGSQEAAKFGVLESVFGYKGVVQSTYISGNAGYIVPYDTIALAARLNQPVLDGYIATWSTIDDKTGLPFGFRAFEHLCYGKALLGCDCLFGCKVIQPTKIALISVQ